MSDSAVWLDREFFMGWLPLLSAPELRLLLFLHLRRTFSNPGRGTVQLSLERLAAGTGRHISVVVRAMAGLRRKGLVEIVPRRGSRRTNLYVLLERRRS